MPLTYLRATLSLAAGIATGAVLCAVAEHCAREAAYALALANDPR